MSLEETDISEGIARWGRTEATGDFFFFFFLSTITVEQSATYFYSPKNSPNLSDPGLWGHHCPSGLITGPLVHGYAVRMPSAYGNRGDGVENC